MRLQFEAVDDRLHVGEDLRLRCVAAWPVVRHERIGIERDLDVALRAGIGVIPPRPARAGRLLEDRERRDAVALEVDGGGDSTEARADDGDGRRAAIPSTHARLWFVAAGRLASNINAR